MNPVSALFLLGVPFGIFYGVDRLGHKTPAANASHSKDSGESSVTFSAGQRRNQAAQLCAI
jgi:hypothetical protein